MKVIMKLKKSLRFTQQNRSLFSLSIMIMIINSLCRPCIVYLIVMIILSSELSSDKNPLIRLPNPNNQVMTYILQLQYEPSLVKSVNAIIYSHNEW